MLLLLSSGLVWRLLARRISSIAVRAVKGFMLHRRLQYADRQSCELVAVILRLVSLGKISRASQSKKTVISRHIKTIPTYKSNKIMLMSASDT